jgi:hypothetical protein
MHPRESFNNMTLPLTMRCQMARYGHFNLRDFRERYYEGYEMIDVNSKGG